MKNNFMMQIPVGLTQVPRGRNYTSSPSQGSGFSPRGIQYPFTSPPDPLSISTGTHSQKVFPGGQNLPRHSPFFQHRTGLTGGGAQKITVGSLSLSGNQQSGHSSVYPPRAGIGYTHEPDNIIICRVIYSTLSRKELRY